MVADVVQLLLITAAVVYLAMHLLSRHDRRRIAELKGREERFRGLTELSADWFWETDAEHRITWLSGGGPVATLAVLVLSGVIPYVLVVFGLIDIALIFRRDRRCLHDLIARTKVVFQ